jgi:cytochrome c oxidase subunit I+III
MGSYGLFHALLVTLMVCFLIARRRAGMLSTARRAELYIVNLWTGYLACITAAILAAAHVPGLFS